VKRQEEPRVPDSRGTDIEPAPDRLQAGEHHFTAAGGALHERLAAFPRFVERPDLSRFIVRYEIFKRILPVQGSIVECGVLHGAGLFTFAHLSAMLEPLHHRRKIIGFDTFQGFPSVHEVDVAGGSRHFHEGGFRGASREELERSVRHFDGDRALREIPKIELVEGDFLRTGAAFLEANPHLIVALLYMDFDLLEPTAEALRLFLPRMPIGSVVAFDESNAHEAPGETRAIAEVIGIPNLRLERTSLGSISWAVLDGSHS
jgi:hypothetical protein